MIVTEDNERTPLKAAAGPPTSPVYRDQQSPPPPPYAAAASHYPFPQPTHYGSTVRPPHPGPPIAPISGVPTPVSYSPHSPLAGSGWLHAQHLPVPYYQVHTRRHVTRRTVKRFLGAYLTSILLLFFVGIFVGGLEMKLQRIHPYIKSWTEDIVTIQFGKRQHRDCVCMPGTGPPSLESGSPVPGPLPIGFPSPLSPRDNGDLFTSTLEQPQ